MTIVEQIKADLASSGVDAAIDRMFDHVDDLFTNGRFQECDALLESLDVRDWKPVMLVAWLSCTSPGRPHLVKREAFFDRVKQSLREARVDDVERLLEGFR